MNEPKPMNSEDLKLFYTRLDSLKCFIDNKLNPLIASACLQVAKSYYGGGAGIIRQLTADHLEWRREFTPEEIAEFELMEKEEIERDLADFTPNLENPMYLDDTEMARWLLAEATTGGDFDDVFENIMIHRYDKQVVATENGEEVIWRRVRTLEESEHILI